MKKIFIILYLWVNIANSYIHFPFGSPFSIKKNEIHKTIIPKLEEKERKIVENIKGFYGLIGPDLKIQDIKSLFQLFIGNGIIQGCFFENGKITFIRKYIKTEKILYEEQCGKIPHTNIHHILFHILNKFNLLPNILGLANTVIMKIENPQKRFFALYERDLPYEINIDFTNKNITTIGKHNIHNINHFSAHSKVNDENNIIESIDYDIIKNQFIYYLLDNHLQLCETIKINTNYFPVIHDFITTNRSIIFADSPLIMKYSEIPIMTMPNKIPVKLLNNKPTFFHIMNKKTKNITKYTLNKSIYILHYAQYEENDNYIDIYAPVYDSFDFSMIDIQGKYCKIHINKLTNDVNIEKEESLEKLNLDFPVKFEDKIILRNIENRICDGFVICKNLDIIQKIYLENRFVCGEHQVLYVEKEPFLISYVFNTNNPKQGYILLINLNTYEKIEIPLETEIYYGFHSIYCE